MKNIKVIGGKYLIPLFFAICIYIALKMDGDIFRVLLIERQGMMGLFHGLSIEWQGMMDSSPDLFPHSITIVLLCGGILLLVKYLSEFHAPLHDKIAAGLFAVIMLLGSCYQVEGDISAIISGKTAFAISICYLLGFYLIFTNVFSIFRICVKWCSAKSISFMEAHSPRELLCLCWAIIYICWLPYIIIRYPAGVEYDAHHQIEQFLGYAEMKAHWPPASSAIMGGVVQLGKILFDSYDIGLFMLALFQAAVSSFVLAYTASFMKRMNVSSVWIAISIVIYALVPIFPGYLTSIVKDSLFADMVVLFIVLLAEELYLPQNRKRIFFIGIIALLVCLLRNNGIYIIIFCSITLLVHIVGKRRKSLFPLLISFLTVCMAYQVYSSVLLPALNIKKGSISEAFSIPFQQTARYFREWPEDISEEEQLIIGKVLDADNIADVYNPLLSDPVKKTYHGSTKELLSYFGVWLKQFVRHPMVYIDATLNNCYGFFFPDAKPVTALSSGLFMGANASDSIFYFTEKEEWKPLRDTLFQYVWLWENNPITFPLCSFGVQICLTIYLFIRAVCFRQKKVLFLFLPSMVGILVCIASPTWWWYGFRYSLPIVYANPTLAGITLMRMDKNE